MLGHLAGTVQMGDPFINPYACVDSHLRVIGVDGLRVADASVMPVLPSGNTHATCMMIGERAADFLLQKVEGVERKRGREEEEQEEGRVKGVWGGEGVWKAMGGWKVVGVALLCAAPLALAYYCYYVRNSEWEEIDDVEDEEEEEEEQKEGERREEAKEREMKQRQSRPAASQPLLAANR